PDMVVALTKKFTRRGGRVAYKPLGDDIPPRSGGALGSASTRLPGWPRDPTRPPAPTSTTPTRLTHALRSLANAPSSTGAAPSRRPTPTPASRPHKKCAEWNGQCLLLPPKSLSAIGVFPPCCRTKKVLSGGPGDGDAGPHGSDGPPDKTSLN